MNKISIESFLEYHFLSHASFSPFGTKAAFLSHKAVLNQNEYNHTLWIYDMENSTEVQLGNRTDYREFIWLNENTILFTVEGDTYDSIIYAVGLDGMEREYAHIYSKISLEGLLNDGRIVLTSRDIPSRTARLEGLRNESRAAMIAEFNREDDHFKILDEYPFWYDGIGFIAGTRHKILIYNPADGSLMPITKKNFSICGLAISESGKQIVYFGNSIKTVEPDTHEVYCWNSMTGQTRQFLKNTRLRISRMAMTKDGKLWIAGRNIHNFPFAPCETLYLMDENDNLTKVGDSEWSFGNLVGSDCRYGKNVDFKAYGSHLWFIATLLDDSFVFSCASGEIPKCAIKASGSIDGLDIYDDNILAIAMRDTKLQELYIYQENGFGQQVTRQNSLICDQMEIMKPQKLRFINSRGNEIHGFFLEPIDKKECHKYPAVLDIHGGPHTVYGSVFFHEMQYWANRGFYVLYCNPTGSAGRGNQFGDIHGAWGSIDYEDIMAFVDTAIDSGLCIDNERLGVTGGSYGGFMVNWIIGHTDRFKAAVTQRSITNFISETGTGDNGMSFLRQQFKFTKSTDMTERLWNISPLRYIKNANTPTLIIHSEEDKRCWYAEGLQLFTALREHGVDSRMILFKDECHELSRSGKPKNRIKRLKEITRWMEHYL